MRYFSVCSGIEAASVAWHPLGWEAVAFSEIEKFPSAVLAKRWPGVPNLGDMTCIEGEKYRGAVELIIGGTPCQDFSIAGKRAGLSGERSGLALHFARLVRDIQPRWIVWENVPGAFSTNGGQDFGAFAGALAELGYGLAWRVLDAQYWGVPQRRRRIFLVGYLGDVRPAGAVLFERESLRRHTPPRGEKGKITAQIPQHVFEATGWYGLDEWPADKASCLSASNQRLDYESETFVPCYPINTQIATRCEALGEGTGLGVGKDGDPAFTLQAAHSHAVCAPIKTGTLAASGAGTSRPAGQGNELDFLVPSLSPTMLRMRSGCEGGGKGPLLSEDKSLTLATGNDQTLFTDMRVRRLTPRECERLQGFPDDYTLIEYRGKPAADGPRYKALGNSMAVPVVRWLGERIAKVDAIFGGEKK